MHMARGELEVEEKEKEVEVEDLSKILCEKSASHKIDQTYMR